MLSKVALNAIRILVLPSKNNYIIKDGKEARHALRYLHCKPKSFTRLKSSGEDVGNEELVMVLFPAKVTPEVGLQAIMS